MAKNKKTKPAAKAKAVKKSAARKPASKIKSKPALKAKPSKPSAKSKKSSNKASAQSSAKKTAAPKKATSQKSAAAKAPKVTGKKSVGGKAGFAWGEFFTPLDDRILIQQAPAEERTAGGLYIPDTVQDKPTRGHVVAVGRGRRSKKGLIRPLDVQLGDQVLYGKYAGTPLQLGGQDVVLLREDDVLAIVNL